MKLFLDNTHSEWQPLLYQAISFLDQDYQKKLMIDNHWLPGMHQLFSAFRMPLTSVQYILLGESPYPRLESANGYAFWDQAVGTLWAPSGLSKAVNRATSLRNFIKMLLIARGDLIDDYSQKAIARLDRAIYWSTASDFFTSLIHRGFLLLNTSLVYEKDQMAYHFTQWRRFLNSLLTQLLERGSMIRLILLGRIAQKANHTHSFPSCLVAEHPYNLSFITNPRVLQFFQPMDLLRFDEKYYKH